MRRIFVLRMDPAPNENEVVSSREPTQVRPGTNCIVVLKPAGHPPGAIREDVVNGEFGARPL